jgi:hypothetical protein
MQGKGEYLNDTVTDTVLVTADTVLAVSPDMLRLRVRDTSKDFRITPTTVLCKDGHAMTLTDLKVGDAVTVTSRIASSTALTVRQGPMLFAGMPGKLILKRYRCDEAVSGKPAAPPQPRVGASDSRPLALAGDALDAVELVITMNSLSTARGWGQELDLAPDLRELVSKYDGKVQFKIDIQGVEEPLLADGAKTVVPSGAKFAVTLQGALNADVRIEEGEVGVIRGEIYAGEGTVVDVNGHEYRYIQGNWIQARAEKK